MRRRKIPMTIPEGKLIDYRIYDPSRPTLFKSSKNDRAECRLLYCTGHEKCDAYKEGCCVMWKFNGQRCPYGTKTYESGYTRRAGKFYDWIKERRKRVEGIEQLDDQKVVCKIGEYIYLPYPHWTLASNVQLSENERGGFFSEGTQFIQQERFTTEFFESIVTAHPQAMMGGEIRSYQKEVVPRMVLHMEEVFPKFFDTWAERYPKTAERFAVRNYVGRKAVITTLKVGATIPDRKGEMMWDGTHIIIDDYDDAFLPIKCERAKVVAVPKQNATIEITSNDQVDKDTKFVD